MQGRGRHSTLSGLTSETSGLVDELVTTIRTLDEANNSHPHTDDVLEAARKYVHDDAVIPAMDAVREVADRLEAVVSDDLWPLPKYSEILFIK